MTKTDQEILTDYTSIYLPDEGMVINSCDAALAMQAAREDERQRLREVVEKRILKLQLDYMDSKNAGFDETDCKHPAVIKQFKQLLEELKP